MDFFDLYIKDYHVAQQNTFYLEKEVEFIRLPSLGFFYSGKYKNIKELPVRKLNTLDEILLCTESLHKNNKLFLELFRNVIDDKNFPVEELVEVDRDTILYWLKIGAYGAKYELVETCNNLDCKQKNKIIFDLSLLQFPDYNSDYINYLKNNDSLVIPLKKNLIFYLVPPTLGKEYEVNNYLDKELNKELIKHKNTKKLLVGIKKIQTSDAEYITVEEIYNYLKTNPLSLKDSKEISSYLNDINPKIVLKTKVTCSNCNNEIIYSLPPITTNFFGFNLTEHKENLDDAINYLTFWGRIDYTSAYHLPSYKRRRWCEKTTSNLQTLYQSK